MKANDVINHHFKVSFHSFQGKNTDINTESLENMCTQKPAWLHSNFIQYCQHLKATKMSFRSMWVSHLLSRQWNITKC